MRAITEAYKKRHSPENFWTTIKEDIFRNAKKESMVGGDYFVMYKEDERWINDTTLTDIVVRELEKLGYQVEQPEYGLIIRWGE